jgi:hypothetical protein
MSMEEAKAHIVGFWDGYGGNPVDNIAIRIDYRHDYLEGYHAGQQKALGGEDLQIPGWVNGGDECSDSAIRNYLRLL